MSAALATAACSLSALGGSQGRQFAAKEQRYRSSAEWLMMCLQSQQVKSHKSNHLREEKAKLGIESLPANEQHNRMPRMRRLQHLTDMSVPALAGSAACLPSTGEPD